MKKIKAVLFDFDGTLVDTNHLILDSWGYASQKHLNKTFPVDVLRKTFGEPLIPSLTRFFPGCDIDEVVRDYRGYQMSHNSEVKIFDGMLELLEELKNRGYMLGIVTSRHWSTSPLARYSFEDAVKYFDVIVSEESTPAHKPDPEPCLIAAEKLGISPDEAVYIGDSRLDIMCARNAGMPSVLVGWSMCCHRDEAVGEAEPDLFIDKPADLLDII